MAGEAAAALLAVQAVQLLMTTFETNLAFGAFLCPTSASISTISSIGTFDYVIVGGGSAGLVVANRLSACSNATVLVLEAGGCPPLESDCVGYFTLQPLSSYDYNMTSVDDGVTCQNLQDNVVSLTSGKMLGGSSGLHHAIMVRGLPAEYDDWATAANDSSWNYENLLPYFIKSETVENSTVLSEYANSHGTSGPMKLNVQHSSKNEYIFAAFEELAYTRVSDTNNDQIASWVITEPLLSIGDKLRQSSLVSYLYPVKDRSNLYVLTGATATKIVFDSDNVATGVEFTYGSSSYSVSASKEVILAAGAIKTPQLLMLSGVGPSAQLENLGIDVVSDVAVGENLQDHASACMLIGLEEDTSTTAAASPFDFPVPTTCNYFNMDNTSAEINQCQSINLVFPHDSAGLLQLCMNVFKYTETICQAMYEANVNRTVLWLVPNLLHPTSRGTVVLNSTDINDQPLVNLNLLSNETEVETLAACLGHMATLVNTTAFTSVGAEFIDLGLCSDYTQFSTDYWKCYAVAMSSTMWHYSGTTTIGTVVDANLLVNGVSNLRVVDASVFPTVPGGNINAAVLAVAEKASDLILAENSSCST